MGGAGAGLLNPVVFDLDGVLIDSRRSITSTINRTLAAAGHPQRPEHELRRFIGPPMIETFREIAPGDDAERLVGEYRARYAQTMAAETDVFDGVPEMLARLADRPLAIATTKARHLAVPLLEALGLAEHFTVIEGPAPDALTETKTQTLARALEQLRGPASAMVGDRSNDIVAARHHGLRAIGAGWGFASPGELEAAGADAIASSPADLFGLLG